MNASSRSSSPRASLWQRWWNGRVTRLYHTIPLAILVPVLCTPGEISGPVPTASVTASGEVVALAPVGTVTVDFASRVPVKSMSGLLLGVSPAKGRLPQRDLYASLKPVIWRGFPPLVTDSLAKDVGARYEYILGDVWGYPGKTGHWKNGPPWSNEQAFVSMVRREARALAADKNVVWEIWNEPTIPLFWTGTEEQFFRTYLVAYRTLREELGPAALIAGPSPNTYNPGFIKRFADYCVKNGCGVNVLVWHEMLKPSAIPRQVRDIRRDIVNNPRYASLRIREIHVNEVLGMANTLNPGGLLLNFQFLEASGIDAAARACWPDVIVPTESSCDNNTLGGMLTRSFNPRSIWWANRLYVDGVSSRVASRSSDSTVFSLASRTGGVGGSANVLLGFTSVERAAPAGMRLALRLSGLHAVQSLARARQVKLRVTEVPESGANESTGPRLLFTQTATVVKDGATIMIPEARRNAFYQVTVQPAN